MGAYLNKPVTDKETETGGNDALKYAATSMQGWRINQEDAHNCIMDIEEGWHLFAVYDGHGGSEVAKYTSLHFPEFLKKRDIVNAEDLTRTLEEAFVDFDDVLRSEPVMKQLKILANGGKKKEEDDVSDEDEESHAQLLVDGSLPLDELLARYGYQMVRNGSTPGDKKHLVTVKHISEIEAEHQAEAEAATAAKEKGEKMEGAEESGEEGGEEEGEEDEAAGVSSTPGGGDKGTKRPITSPIRARAKRAKSDTSNEGEEDGKEEENGKKEGDQAEGENVEEEKKAEVVEGKRTTAVPVSPRKFLKSGERAAARDAKMGADSLAQKVDMDGSSSDDEDYQEPDGEDDEEEEEVDEGEEDEDEVDDEMDGISGMACGPSGETPGVDSGTTACVCLLAPGKVIVANVGDSRAVLSRAGRAIDLSVDHKPEDDIEKERIHRAGGTVNEDGRVNGGLNLSRAFGDHCYKKNKTLHLRDQMISAQPDIKMESLTEEDEFIVVACDGIWNSYDSQQVVDIVDKKLKKGFAAAKICEQMCHLCLADSTAGDGTGCDNMTVIIIDLKPGSRPEKPEGTKEDGEGASRQRATSMS